MKKEVKIGLVALIALVVAYFGFSYLMGIQIFKSGPTYYAVYSSADGISSDNKVQMNGINVGKVRKVTLLPDGKGVLISFYISHNDVSITDSTVARITSLDLFGSKAIVLSKTNQGIPLNEGDTLISETEGDLRSAVDERLRPLEQKTNDLIGSMDSLVTTIQIILDEETRNNLTNSIKRISNSLSIFERTAYRVDTIVESEAARLDSIIYNVHVVSQGLKNNTQQVDNILKNISTVSDSLAKADVVGTFDKAGKAMESVASVMEKIDRGEGTAGMLVNNDSLYNQLNEAAVEMDKLLEDMRVNPGRYMHFSVFGRRERSAEKPKKKER